MWDPQVELPERRFRTVRFDVRGHGGAAGPPDEYALDNLGRAAEGRPRRGGARRDVATPLSDNRWLQEHIRDSGMRILDTAHLAAVERPHDFSRLVEEFLT